MIMTMQRKIRPDVVTIKATHKTTKEVKVYTLTKDNNWTMFTDIKKDDREKWSFVKMFLKVIL